MSCLSIPEPNAKQDRFFCETRRHIGYGGARGGGKSWAMRQKFVMLALRYPGLKLLLLRRTLPELRENHILPLLAEIAGVASYNGEEKAFSFPNGSRIKLGYCEHEVDVYQYQGQEYDVIGFEEATHFTQAQVEFLLTCNRTTRSDFAPRAYYTANPGNVGHAWFKRLFISRDFRGDERPEDYVFIPARLYDNTVLMEADPSYERGLKNLPTHLRRAFLDGDWDVFAGQMFTQFNRDIHVIDPIEIPPWWERWGSNDPGYNDPGVWYWFAADQDGTVYVYREATFERVAYLDQAKEVRKLMTSHAADDHIPKVNQTVENISYWVTGMDAFVAEKSTREGKSYVDYYGQGGIFGFRKPVHGAGARANMAGTFHEYLKPIEKDGKPTARLKIFSTCRKLIETLPMMQMDEDHPEQVAECRDDHWYQACGYGLQSRHAAKATEPDKKRAAEGTWARVLNWDGDDEPERRSIWDRGGKR